MKRNGVEIQCPLMSRPQGSQGVRFVNCLGDACGVWEEMTNSCSFKAQQRHTRALSVSFTELGMALIDMLKKMQEDSK